MESIIGYALKYFDALSELLIAYRVQTCFELVGGMITHLSLNTRAADSGYQPTLTSLEGVLQETSAILQQQTSQVTGT
jgi:hypothetical protein